MAAHERKNGAIIKVIKGNKRGKNGFEQVNCEPGEPYYFRKYADADWVAQWLCAVLVRMSHMLDPSLFSDNQLLKAHGVFNDEKEE